MSERNKALVRRWFEECDRAKGPVEEVCTPGFTAYHPDTPPMDLATFRRATSVMFAAIPDLRHTVEDLIAEGSKVAGRVSIRGTHQGELMGISPTGRQIEVSGVVFARIEGDKVAEYWGGAHKLGVMKQIGASPVAPP